MDSHKGGAGRINSQQQQQQNWKTIIVPLEVSDEHA